MKKLALTGQTAEAEIVNFLKMDVVVDWDTKHKGVTVDEEWVKELLRRCAHIHWVAMGEHEKRVSGRGKAELEHEGWQQLAQTGMPADVIELAKAFCAQWTVQKRGTANVNMHPPGGPPIR